MKFIEEMVENLDAGDELASFRERFYMPQGVIYLDGNSLGLMSRDAEQSIFRAMDEWKTKAIDGWLNADPPWFYLAEKLGALAAPLVGAKAHEVIVTASTTINIHSLVSTFFQPQGDRTKILADELNFPSDIYALKGQLKIKGQDPDKNLVLVPGINGILSETDIIHAMGPDVALALLPSVLYRSGQLLDMERLTHEAHKRDILIGFDCSHSVGALPHEFDQWGVDFAVWCGYKYLNGGPGCPAFIYVNEKHSALEPLMAGWFDCDKSRQFDMSLDFQQAGGAGAWQISTPVVLAAAAMEGALNMFAEAGIREIRQRSIYLNDFLVTLVDALLTKEPYSFQVVTPRPQERRGGHIALRREKHAAAICRALRARGVVPDFRPPDIIRFAPVALYNNAREIGDMVKILMDIVDKEEYLAYENSNEAVT